MRLLLLAAAAAFLAACTAPPADAPAEAPAAVTAGPQPHPVAISIPAIGAESSLIATGMTPEGQLEVPDVNQPEQASWWDGSPPPGAPGPAVILGHVDGDGGRPGVFYRLRDLEPGDEVLVDRADGSRVRFVVDNVLHLPKSDFPTGQVYGDVPRPELRLITCGGDFDRAAGHYRGQVIAFAHLQENP